MRSDPPDCADADCGSAKNRGARNPDQGNHTAHEGEGVGPCCWLGWGRFHQMVTCNGCAFYFEIETECLECQNIRRVLVNKALVLRPFAKWLCLQNAGAHPIFTVG